jgi:amino acid transporter
MMLIPWDEIGVQQSPFVLVFDRVGLPAAASLINFVVLTAVLSSSNSGLFATGRTLAALAFKGHAPAWLHKHTKNGLPVRALSVTALLILCGVVVNYLNPSRAFGLLATASIMPLMWSWISIAVSHWCFRHKFPHAVLSLFQHGDHRLDPRGRGADGALSRHGRAGADRCRLGGRPGRDLCPGAGQAGFDAGVKALKAIRVWVSTTSSIS